MYVQYIDALYARVRQRPATRKWTLSRWVVDASTGKFGSVASIFGIGGLDSGVGGNSFLRCLGV